MRNIVLFFLLLPFLACAQNNIKKTAAIPYTQGPPTFTPGFSASSEIAIDTSTGKIYQFHRTTMTWLQLGQGIDVISGSIPPAYTPARNMSVFAINAVDSLYHYSGGSWVHLNPGGSGGGVSDGDYGDIDVTSTATVWTVDTSSISTIKIAADAVDSTKIVNGGVSVLDIGQHGAASGEILKWNGTQWLPGSNDWGSQIVEVDSVTIFGDGTTGNEIYWGGASVTGSLTGSGTTLAPLDVIDNGIGNTELRQSAGLSVIGRAANSAGNVADITAGTDGHVLRLSGTTLGFGTVATAGIATGAVTSAKTSGFTNNSITHANGSGVLTGDGTFTFETNTIRMYPTANDTLLAFYTPNGRMFGIRSFTDPLNGATDAIQIGGLASNTRLFLKGYEIYPDANFRQYLTAGIGFLGSTGSLYLHPNGDYYTATLTGDNQTDNRNTTFYFVSGGATTGKGNPVIFQQIFSNNDTLCNSFEFLARNTASGGITHPDSTLFRVGNWDRGAALNILQNRKIGIQTKIPNRALTVAGDVAIGYTATPSAAAALEITSTTQGVLLPRMTTTQRDAITATAGLVIFNTTTTKMECYDGSTWQAAW